MSNVKIELLEKGLEELMKSEEIQEELLNQANNIVTRCSGNYETDVYVGKTRANASVVTRDAKTYHKNLKTNELLKAAGIK